MSILFWLTIGYAAVLVLVLAAGLTAIWLQLRAIDRGLVAARDSLVRVMDASAPLEDGIAPLRGAFLDAVRSLQRAAAELESAGQEVGRRLEPTAVGRG